MEKNKIIYGGKVLLDLTNNTVSSDTLIEGTTAHDKSGRIITGNLVPTDKVLVKQLMLHIRRNYGIYNFK